jgi:hypothetical protein
MITPSRTPPVHRFAWKLSCALLGVALLSGCTTSANYFTDRWNDAKDICTATVGVGAGAKARVGPIGTGLHWVRDYAGLRGGDFGDLKPKANDTVDGGLLVFGVETSPETDAMRLRNKEYMTWQWLWFHTPAMMDDTHHPGVSFYTQIEVAAGAGGSVRLGLNPGELLDFLFGWLGADLYGDDQASFWPKRRPSTETTDPTGEPGVK